jgi:hypothetical protein
LKTLLALLASIVCVGGANANTAFIQGRITIVPPVTQEHSGRGYRVDLYNDGGTKRIKLTDAAGKEFDVYIDHRIGTATPGAIYLFDYPGKPHSVRVRDEHDFDQKIRFQR